MLLDIGAIVGFYALARLVPSGKLSRALSAVAAIVTLIALADLSSHAVQGRSIASRASSPTNLTSASTDPVTPGKLAPRPTTVTRAPGGSIQTVLGFGYVLAKGSSLNREWIAVHDASMPAKFDGTPGLTTVYERGGQYSNGEYRYRSKFTLATSDDVQAVEVRFLAFDVWGEHMQTFRCEEVADMSTGSAKPVTGEWRLFSENDAEKFYASIGYVSRVRLKSGRVVTAEDAPVVEEARKFSAKFSATDLEPPKPTPGR